MALLTRIKTHLALTARRPALGLLDGEYASARVGRGGDFTDLREYVPGDDLRDLDWKATARRGTPLVRRYLAERKHTVVFAVRGGRHLAAMANPSDSKRDLAITLSGMIGWLALRHGDHVGLVIGDGDALLAHRPTLTELGLERLLLAVQESAGPRREVQSLAELLEHTHAALRRRSIVIVISDAAPLTAEDESWLRRLRSRHQVLMLIMSDLNPVDPAVRGRVVDVHGGRRLPAFLARTQLRHQVERLDREQSELRSGVLTGAGIPHVEVGAVADAPAAVFLLLQRSRHAH